MVAGAPVGSTIVVGTEWHLVNRLAHEFTDRQVVPLAERQCRTMAMTRLPHLLMALDSILAGSPVNVVQVDEAIAADARLALDRMIEAS